MKKLIALMAVLAAPAAADDAALLGDIESYLNSIETLEARILQVSSENTFAEGTLFMERPGRMRIEYDPPSDVLLLADGEYLIYAEKLNQQATHIKLEDTPAAYLLSPALSFADPDLQVSDVVQDAGLISLTLASAKDPDSGALTLTFTEGSELSLQQWSLVDAQNVEVRVTLYDTKIGTELDDDLFRLPDDFGEEDD